MELATLKLEDMREYYDVDSLKDLGTVEFVQVIEITLALAVDACEETENFASSVMETSDGRYIIVEAKYADGIPLTAQYAHVKTQRDSLYNALAAICVKPDEYCCCINQVQDEPWHTGECMAAQQALALYEETVKL